MSMTMTWRAISHIRPSLVFGNLRTYACATTLLITQRLHAAMPAAAMGTPVLLIDDPHTLPGGGGPAGELRLAGEPRRRCTIPPSHNRTAPGTRHPAPLCLVS